MGGLLKDYGELGLLIFMAIAQVLRWSQKMETEPMGARRLAADALMRVKNVEFELRKHKHNFQAFLNGRYTEMDQTYARKREVDLQVAALNDKVDGLEEKLDVRGVR